MHGQTKQGKQFTDNFEIFIKSGRSYVGLVGVLEDGELKPAARILFHIISSLSVLQGYCFATNQTLGNKLGLQTTMVKQYLKELANHQLIEIREVEHLYGMRREIYIRFDVLQKRYKKEA